MGIRDRETIGDVIEEFRGNAERWHLDQKEVKRRIEEIQEDFYLDKLPIAYKRVTDLIEKDPSKLSDKERSQQIHISMKAIEAAGIIGNSPSMIVQKLTQINILTTEESKQLIGVHLKNLLSFEGGENDKKKEG